ncbi:MAG: hypothetical protein H6552_10265, partial [Chitinophagales bacterium]|nr:hypothetical protein [Chitinophagales bacterium]
MRGLKQYIIMVLQLIIAVVVTNELKAQNYCVSGNCNPNIYAYSLDPNTIEYDNMISVFHSSMIREADGTVKVWGQGVAQNGNGTNGNVLTTTDPAGELSGANFGSGSNQLTGTVLKFAGASSSNHQQFAVLSTNGLYVWGDAGILVPNVSNVSNGSFRKVAIGTYNVSGGATKADGLPAGVNPTDVKMMFGTREGLAIVTCTGAAYTLTTNGVAYGDGVTDNSTNDLLWHRVSTAANTPLTNVVAVRGTYQTFMALTSDGKIYTWGTATRINGTGGAAAAQDRSFATEINQPTGVTPKMIGMTASSNGKTYYLLATNGKLFSMGDNTDGQLGNGSTTSSDTWIQVTATTTAEDAATYAIDSNVVWISPQEHDRGTSIQRNASISIITNDGKVWSWGGNNGGMLGITAPPNLISTPSLMPGRITGTYDNTKLNLSDVIMAVETGGHTTLLIKQCSKKFGYVGHRIRGSMADGTTVNAQETVYNFGNTGDVIVCGAPTSPDPVQSKNLKTCIGDSVNLNDAILSATPPGFTLEWWTTSNRQAGTQVANPLSQYIGTYYAFYIPNNSSPCPNPTPATITVTADGIGCPPQNLCISGCNDNTFRNTSNPNTLEYDNVVGLYHSTMLKEKSGELLVWGARAQSNGSNHGLTPIEVLPSNGYSYQGDILKFAGGSESGVSAQFAVLTTEGLYYWGAQGIMVPTSFTSGTSFAAAPAASTIFETGTNPTGLPIGVQPSDVKMMTGTRGSLAIVTCDGKAFVLDNNGYAFGDGITSTSNNANEKWHRVLTAANTPLTNVVAIRTTVGGFMALTDNQNIYTWGKQVYKGDGSAAADQAFATLMTKPTFATGDSIRMIGVVQNQGDPTTQSHGYFLLMKSGKIFSMGSNASKQLGDFSTSERTSWVSVLSASGGSELADVRWISANGQGTRTGNSGFASIAALTNAGHVWAWGSNSADMLGPGSGTIDPRDLNLTTGSGLISSDDILAIVMGGHTLIAIKKCINNFGYVGHRIFGSMGDGTSASAYESSFVFDRTPPVNLCGASTAPRLFNLKVCPNAKTNLSNAEPISLVTSGYSVQWYLEDSITLVSNPDSVGAGTYVAKYIPDPSQPLLCPNMFTAIRVTEDAINCINAVNDTFTISNRITGGTTPSVLGNDKLNGNPVNPSDIILTPGTPSDPALVMNPD